MIRPWEPCDAEQVSLLIARFLLEQPGSDLVPTARNVQLLYEIGRAGVERGDPCLLYEDQGTICGYIEWCDPAAGFQLHLRTLHTFGSYIREPYRHAGLAVELRRAAERIAIDRGYQRIIGPVSLQNWKGVEHFISEYGAWPTVVQFEYRLGEANGRNDRSNC